MFVGFAKFWHRRKDPLLLRPLLCGRVRWRRAMQGPWVNVFFFVRWSSRCDQMLRHHFWRVRFPFVKMVVRSVRPCFDRWAIYSSRIWSAIVWWHKLPQFLVLRPRPIVNRCHRGVGDGFNRACRAWRQCHDLRRCQTHRLALKECARKFWTKFWI